MVKTVPSVISSSSLIEIKDGVVKTASPGKASKIAWVGVTDDILGKPLGPIANSDAAFVTKRTSPIGFPEPSTIGSNKSWSWKKVN